jgi:hypothetical protein
MLDCALHRVIAAHLIGTVRIFSYFFIMNLLLIATCRFFELLSTYRHPPSSWIAEIMQEEKGGILACRVSHCKGKSPSALVVGERAQIPK